MGKRIDGRPEQGASEPRIIPGQSEKRTDEEICPQREIEIILRKFGTAMAEKQGKGWRLSRLMYIAQEVYCCGTRQVAYGFIALSDSYYIAHV